MKSRKKVSRKKAAHNTRSRRGPCSRSKRRTKRGGMIRSARTLFYHDILPLLSRARLNIYLGREPTPDEYAITKENDRYYGTILDIPVDNGIKESIKNLREELGNPVKTADRMKSIKDDYDAIIKKLEEEKKKQFDKQRKQGLMVVGKAFTPPPSERLIASGAASGVGSGDVFLSKESLINRPLTFSPSTRYPEHYSTNTKTPQKPRIKSDIRPSDYELQIIGTPLRNPFNNGEPPINSPYFSPPPPDQIINQENQNPQLLLSPGPTPAGRLNFDLDLDN